MKKTVVLGASDNPSRYSFLAVERLREKGHPVVAVGKREGKINDTLILTGEPLVNDVDTVTLYLNPVLQVAAYDYILGLKPRRVIFNPGTENDELEEMLRSKGIEPVEACTLVMLAAGMY
ncbi:MAG: CoA-binding protein [Sediminibacterium sp.]|jgi:predicted CoA-binding protein|nr:CoA-binding protein [Chitinophagaceae bacterium]MCA6469390.1 CoA-binding protein [Chitinophagaceae bacterium]MCA6477422.1 CoA-binding protein [Chitinophagaceae bacterium]MCA6479566.1 CoA-binding protein [Chitinophagaceae bacterium]MCA6492550.1 CoA-binding protein [Chitinophagaceae bacterium]